mmetsp:Transcript_37598/g.78753  ORF Transcript_37598/g.78753 Transcript_37598/m.78753 type:complete len:131 (+) Transcript_37598:157-549(+)
MQYLYNKVVSHPHPMYSPPKGKVGNLFLTRFTAELRKVRARETNLERAMIFPACILWKEPGIRSAKEIRRWILQRLQLWDEGKFAELVNDITNVARQGTGGLGGTMMTRALQGSTTRWSPTGGCGRGCGG